MAAYHMGNNSLVITVNVNAADCGCRVTGWDSFEACRDVIVV